MDIYIKKGNLQHINDCEEILVHSELGQRYFSERGSAKKAIREGLKQKQLFVALESDICVGFVWYIPKGAFHSFPYLHIIAVEENHRGKGIGTKMIDYLEKIVFKDTDKIFLVVADFNPSARQLYEKIGYRQVGEIPNLYRKGITEYLMMKERK